MHYSTNRLYESRRGDEVKVAVLADSLRKESSNRLFIQDVVLAVAAIALGAAFFTLG